MTGVALAQIQGNVGIVQFPSNIPISIKAKTNSTTTQKITLNQNNQEIGTFTGSGERNTIIGQSSLTGGSEIQVRFEYSLDGESWKPSILKSGGPYMIGSYNILVIVAENGDDSDYNDSILEFSWYTR